MTRGDISALLAAARRGDSSSQSRLFEAVYDELKRLAAAKLRNERSDHTLQPSALVNEACIKLLGQAHVGWDNRAHFFKTASGVMRHILCDHARARCADKRHGNLLRVDLDTDLGLAMDAERVLAVDLALDQLAAVDERKARVFELRWYGGFDVDQTAKLLGISEKTVKRDWQFARNWFKSQLVRDAGAS